ncbi:MAG: UDP-N-acetylglucosamine 1-carboxyvinyltransferase [Parcubacteria group bacterium]|nr:UDP-N-acetylglucosamine 1-carboxyvinyltransferase [Parcubacteria group bacterium]
MSKLIINGGKPLAGKVNISGSKNAAVALIAASVLAQETRLSNVPRIKDVQTMLEIIAYLGGSYNWLGEHELIISTEKLASRPLPDLARKLRASVLFAGPMLARFGRMEMPYPGGDLIGGRSLSTHLNGFRKLGLKVDEGDNLSLRAGEVGSNIVVLEEPSVTATENILMLAAGLDRPVEIHLAAAEPHVQNLCEFLTVGGVTIQGLGTPMLKIGGRKLPLDKIDQTVIPDELEVSAFAVLAAVTRSRLELSPVDYNFLDAVLLQLEKMNVNFESGDGVLRIMPPLSLYRPQRIQSGLYPKLVSDHLPPFAVLATQAEGASLVHEWLYESRQNYLRELIKMGANAQILDPHRALIVGPTSLYGKEVASYDIRSGMSMVVAALAARGRTVISGVEHIDRGYEKLEERLRGIGAEIVRIE